MGTNHPPGPNTRRRILAAAERVFAERGFKAATIDAISSSAGVNRALIYYYFKNKQQVYRHLVQKGASAFQAIFDSLPMRPTPIGERLRAFVGAYVHLCLDDSPLARMVRRELAGGDGETSLVAEPFQEVTRRLAQVLAEGIDSGDLRPLDPQAMARSLMGMMNILYDVTALTHTRVDADEAAAHTVDLFLGGAATRPAGTVR